jgi:hypothetical protein
MVIHRLNSPLDGWLGGSPVCGNPNASSAGKALAHERNLLASFRKTEIGKPPI